MENQFKNKVVLVTGGTGSIGSEIVKQLLKLQPKQVRVLSRNDSRQHQLFETLGHPENVRMFIGDIRDKDRLDLAFQNVDIIFHAAALKHVPLCEYNPFETVKTNIIGSQNVIETALRHGVKKIVAISTDKAADPANIMGISKLMMEKLFINTNLFTDNKMLLSCVRFGNVAWADGSVLPAWDQQVKKTNTMRLTDGEMTRFMMSIKQAVALVLKAAELTQGGEVFILKMPSVKIKDLAKMFLKKYHSDKKVSLTVVGNRPGDKVHESLINSEEKRGQIYANQEMLVVVPLLNTYNRKQLTLNRRYFGFKLIDVNETLLASNSSKSSIDHKKIAELI